MVSILEKARLVLEFYNSAAKFCSNRAGKKLFRSLYCATTAIAGWKVGIVILIFWKLLGLKSNLYLLINFDIAIQYQLSLT